MILDVRTLPDTVIPEADICIVGGGLAGIVLAREFVGKPVRVCVLESGGWDPQPAAVVVDAMVPFRNGGLPYSARKAAEACRFGGSTQLWNVPIGGNRLGARLRPLDPIDFEKRDWVPYSGWPFPKTHLDPYYDKAQAICRVEPTSFEVADWEDCQARPRLPLSDDQVKTIIYKFVARDTIAKEYTKAVSRADNIFTFLHAHVLEIETNPEENRVEQLRVGTLDGKRFTVRAKLFILAGGGIGIPRLLLLSNKTTPAGLGNQNDLVGRFFMEHPHFWQGILVPANPGFSQAAALYNEVHTARGVPIIGKLALPESVLRRERLLNQNIQLVPRRIPDPFKLRASHPASVESLKTICSDFLREQRIGNFGQHFKNISGGLHEIALAGAQKVRSRLFGNSDILAYYFANMSEQTPNPQSRVTLSADRDAFGRPCAELDWHLNGTDIRSAARTEEIIGHALERAGLGRFYREIREDEIPAKIEGGYHFMGTTRMHREPQQGVVNADCRLHGVQNLFVAGPSVFPTGGYANPVLTIIALTVRLADHLKAVLGARGGT